MALVHAYDLNGDITVQLSLEERRVLEDALQSVVGPTAVHLWRVLRTDA